MPFQAGPTAACPTAASMLHFSSADSHEDTAAMLEAEPCLPGTLKVSTKEVTLLTYTPVGYVMVFYRNEYISRSYIVSMMNTMLSL